MPLSNARSDATDGNTAQWDKVKEMRDRQAAAERGEPSGTPVIVTGIEPPAETPPVETPPAKVEPNRDPVTGQFTKAPDGTPAPGAEPPAEAPKTAAPASATPPAPTTREVEIDGVKVQLSPDLADVFEKAEKVNREQSAVADRDKLKAEIREELRAEMPVVPQKSEAELAGERALADAERAKNAPKKPESKLMIENPEEYEKQRDAYEEWRTSEAIRRANETRDAKDREQAVAVARANEKNARDVLRVQFYDANPALKESADLVDVVMNAHFDDMVASGKLKNAAALPPAEREKMKQALFASIAVTATKRLVKLMHGGKAVAPPPPPPPQLNSSQAKQAPGQREVQPPKEEAKPKYPKGSISAVLAERKAKLAGASA